jgi:hypothetical protein
VSVEFGLIVGLRVDLPVIVDCLKLIRLLTGLSRMLWRLSCDCHILTSMITSDDLNSSSRPVPANRTHFREDRSEAVGQHRPADSRGYEHSGHRHMNRATYHGKLA